MMPSVPETSDRHSIRKEATMKNAMLGKAGKTVMAVALATALVPTGVVAAWAAQNAGADSNDSANSGSTPPAKPDGSSSSDASAPSAPPDGNGGPSDNDGQAPDGTGSGQGGGANTQTFDYSGTYSGVLSASGTTKASTGETISATASDQNAVLAQNAATLTVQGATITKSGDDDNGDNCNFYGVNSSVLAVGENTTLNIADSSISSTSAGSNGIFATDNATVNANNVSITTTDGGNSRGLDATYGGTIVANKMSVSTQKDHCAAVATDRGGGSISVTNSQLDTAGSGSPVLYSTGDITVDHVQGTASGSQIAGMEGKNVIRINNSDLSSTNDATSGSDPIKNGVIIYQSTSGDADTSASTQADFEVSDSTLSTSISDGAMFYVTNTDANIVVSNSQLNYDSSKVELLHAAGNNTNSWGTSGSNSGNATLTAISQSLNGNVYVDSISNATLYLTNSSTWTGAVASQNATSDGTTAAPSNATVNIDGSSKWVVTGDTTVGNLNVAQGGSVVDASGAAVTVVDASGNVLVQGSSSIKVTVSGSYSATVDTSAAGSIQGASEDLTSARASFDALYGTSTSWATNSAASIGADDSATVIDNTGTSTSASAVTVNTKTVTSASIAKAIKAANTTKKSVTTLTLGKKVKTIKSGALSKLKNLKTVKIKSSKLTKSSVTGSLKNSSVTKVKVAVSKSNATNKKYVAKYKKAFAKANSGKSVKVVSA